VKKNLFYIQIGAYQNQATARSIAKNYESQSYVALVLEPFRSDRRKIYRVRIGGFQTRGQAEEALNKIAKQEGKRKIDYFIVQY
jgi:cell division septation protein DedD